MGIVWASIPPPKKGNGNSEGREGLNRDNSVGLGGGLLSLLFPGLRVKIDEQAIS